LSAVASGVWANPDAVFVRAGRFAIWFERRGAVVTASVRSYAVVERQVSVETWVRAVFDSASDQATVWSKGIPVPEGWDRGLAKPRVCALERPEGTSAVGLRKLVCDAVPVEVLDEATFRLTLQTDDDEPVELVPLERIETVPASEGRRATAELVGTCLQEWALGVSVWQDEETGLVTLDIRTNRHSFVAGFGGAGPESLAMFRGARVRCTNDGVAEAPYVRLLRSSSDFAGWMMPDVGSVAAGDLEVDDRLLDTDPRRFSSPGNCWSLEGVGEDLILLRDGGGEEYRFERPTGADDSKVVHIEHRDYDEAKA